jgi:hypothetical protein
MIEKDIYNWFLTKREFLFKDFVDKFKLDEDNAKKILNEFVSGELLIEVNEDNFWTKEMELKLFENKIENEIFPKIRIILKELENSQSPENVDLTWESMIEIEKFVIYEGVERIYEIHKKVGDNLIKVKLEGKEIMDYNTFRLRLFEESGNMLKTYKGIGADWAKLVNHWHKTKGVILKDKAEFVSDTQEARDLIIDYIENSTVTEDYLVKEGIITVREDCIYVPIKIIKKILKRNNIQLTIRKLAYELNEYLAYASIPLKIENKSERFWRFKKIKFNINLIDKIEIDNQEELKHDK